jgi:GDP-L-fucose synthase
MENYSEEGHVNVGTGVDLPIRELAEKIRDVVHPDAELVFDTSKPDGMMRKVLDTSKLTALGWKPSITLDEGIRSTYEWFLDQTAVRGAG